jgi:hypothetical protein
MEYINTDDFENSDIKLGALSENFGPRFEASTTRYVANPIVDDIEADPTKGRARRKRVNGRIVIDTAVPEGWSPQYQAPSCPISDHAARHPSINDLAAQRWQGRTVDAETERELIRRIQEGDPRCRAGSARGCTCRSCRAFFDPRPNTVSLLPAFHHSIRKIAGAYVPKGSPRRSYKKTIPAPEGSAEKRDVVKGSDSLIFQDLMAIGSFGLLKSALEFDFDQGRLWTIARRKIDGLISNEANYLRQKGYTSGDTVGRYLRKEVGRRTQSRIDRWIFDHLSSPPEELLEAQRKLGLKRTVFHSLQEAVDALKAASALEHCGVYSDDGEDGGGDIPPTAATEPSQEFRDLYDSYNRLQLDDLPDEQRNAVDLWVDLWIDRLVNFLFAPPRKKPKVFAKKPYDPDRRVVRSVKMKDGTTKRLCCQMATGRGRHIKVTVKLNAKYVAMIESNQPKREPNVRPNRSQKISRATAEIVVFQSRASGVEGLHLGERRYPPRIGQRFTGARIAGQ